MSKYLVVRADANARTGSGHLMRCLSQEYPDILDEVPAEVAAAVEAAPVEQRLRGLVGPRGFARLTD